MLVTMKKFQIALIFGIMENQVIQVEMKIVLLYKIREDGMMLLVMARINLHCVKNLVIINRLIAQVKNLVIWNKYFRFYC